MTFNLRSDKAASRFEANVLGRGAAEGRIQLYRDEEAQDVSQHPSDALSAGLGCGALFGGATGAVSGATDCEGFAEDHRRDGALLGLDGGAPITGIGQGFTTAAQALGRPPAGWLPLSRTARTPRRASDGVGVVVPQEDLSRFATTVADPLRTEGYNVRLHPRPRAVLVGMWDLAASDRSLSRVEVACCGIANAAQFLKPDERRLAAIASDKIDDAVASLVDASAALQGTRTFWPRMSRLGRTGQNLEDARNSRRRPLMRSR